MAYDKIQVPAEILSKPGRLNEAEFALIKNHPQTGYEVLKNIKFPWPIAQIVLQHHERLDGSGYPQGLKGDQIMLEARILIVADVVEETLAGAVYMTLVGVWFDRVPAPVMDHVTPLFESSWKRVAVIVTD